MSRAFSPTKEAAKLEALRGVTREVARALQADTRHDAIDVIDTTCSELSSSFYIDVTYNGRDMRIVLEDHHAG